MHVPLTCAMICYESCEVAPLCTVRLRMLLGFVNRLARWVGCKNRKDLSDIIVGSSSMTILYLQEI